MKAVVTTHSILTKINNFRSKTYRSVISAKNPLTPFSISLTNLLTLNYYLMEVCTGSVQLSHGVLLSKLIKSRVALSTAVLEICQRTSKHYG
jgi:hypothetical protein